MRLQAQRRVIAEQLSHGSAHPGTFHAARPRLLTQRPQLIIKVLGGREPAPTSVAGGAPRAAPVASGSVRAPANCAQVRNSSSFA
jgi:hypothetical protein